MSALGNRRARKLALLHFLLAAALVASCLTACGPGDSFESDELDQIEEPLGYMSRADIINLGSTVKGYSYWWGHGRWRTDGTQKGSCSGSCPSCSHSGAYGADCSGFVAKAWQVPQAISISTDAHPYSTYNFYNETTHWKKISRGSALAGDAMVYRSGGGGHIFIYHKGDPWGAMWTYECKGCSSGCVYNLRTAGSHYTAIRRNAISGSSTTTAPNSTCAQNCANYGCMCVDGKCSGGFCEGNGCSTEQTGNCAKFGCKCVDGKCSGGYCNGSGCTAKRSKDCAAYGCGCVDGQCSGGYCPGTGCTAKQTNNCAAFGCTCVDGKCNGGYCPGTGCTAKETTDCSAYACGCADHKCSGGYACGSKGNGCTAKETTDCGKYGCDCYDHKCSGGFCQ